MGKKQGQAERRLLSRAGEAKSERQQQVAQRAYELYLARGSRDGSDLDDWLDAEQELANAA